MHDPASSLRDGDIVSISPGWRASKHVRHVVSSIIAPFGEPIERRPPVPTEEERMAERAKRKAVKDERRRVARLGAVGEVEVVDEGGVVVDSQSHDTIREVKVEAQSDDTVRQATVDAQSDEPVRESTADAENEQDIPSVTDEKEDVANKPAQPKWWSGWKSR